jgi:predicted NBD/HSP70 family sugar kinase
MRWIGIDIGGSKIRAILWNGRRVIRAMESRTPKNGSDFIGTLLALALMVSRRKPVRAVGIGAAGIVKGTTLVFSPNIPFIRNFDFRLLWPRSVRLRVDNDARCFVRAELLRGAGRGAKSLFALTIGTGVGRAYGRNGKTVKLKEFEYPEPWEEKYQRVSKRRDDGKLADFLGWQLVPLIAPFEPAIIVVGGGVMERARFLQRLQRSFKAHGLRASVVRARLGKNAVAVGAALLFKN